MGFGKSDVRPDGPILFPRKHKIRLYVFAGLVIDLIYHQGLLHRIGVRYACSLELDTLFLLGSVRGIGVGFMTLHT